MPKRAKPIVKNKSVPLFKYLIKILSFIIKIPYYILNSLILLFQNANEKIKETKVERKRESLTAAYAGFEIIQTFSGDYKEWESKIIQADSKIGIILGARGSGKTAFGIKFLENLYAKTKKRCYTMGFNKEDMPAWIHVIEDIQQIRNNSFILIDEGGVLFSSRDAMTRANKVLSDLMLISRHKNLSILFISQNSSNLDIDILRQADYLVFKQSSLLQLDFERKKIKELYTSVQQDFEKYKDVKGVSYIYSDLFRGFVSNPIPSFWSVNISKSFK